MNTSSDTNQPPAGDLVRQAQDKLQQATSQQDYEEAAGILKQAVKTNPNDYDSRMTLGWVYLDKLRQPHTAYFYLRSVVKHSPNDVNARKLLGEASMQTGRNGQAVEQFRAALSLQPNDPWIKANLGRSLAREGNYGEARDTFNQILQRDPNNADAKLGQAEVAAWTGHSEEALEILRGLETESPTNVEALTLMGNIHRWKWKLSEAKEDYRQALNIDTNATMARTGLEQAKQAGAPEISGNAYYFKDTAQFLREYAGGSVRIPLTDQAYLTAGGADWHFNSPGVGNEDRADGRAGLEYHWTRWLETTASGDFFDYYRNTKEDNFWGGELAAKISPMNRLDIYATVSGNQPFVSSIATVTNALKQNSVGAGLDWRIWGPFSIQNSLQLARISDNNKWWEDQPQLSLHLFKLPDTFLRVQYDHLSYSHFDPRYWTPHNRNVVSPILDVTLPICRGFNIILDGRAPYVFDQRQWGYQFEGSPAFNITDHAQIKASYYNSRVPGDQGVWSGQGGQITLSIWF